MNRKTLLLIWRHSGFLIQRRSVTSRYHGSKISGSQQSFWTETVVCIVDRLKKRMGCCFVPDCNHAQESHTSYLQDHGLLRTANFATMATWRNDFSFSILVQTVTLYKFIRIVTLQIRGGYLWFSLLSCSKSLWAQFESNQSCQKNYIYFRAYFGVHQHSHPY